jgi:Rrf2 family protein
VFITRATEYAIRAVLHMAKQPPGEVVYKKDICQAQDVTPAFLTKILQPLIKAGIVGSQRGVGGGFYLLKHPAEITLLDILTAEEGPLYLNQCLTEERACSRDLFCPVHGCWQEIRENFAATLSGYSFQDLVNREHPSSTPPRR